jgi:hypothetical protein
MLQLCSPVTVTANDQTLKYFMKSAICPRELLKFPNLQHFSTFTFTFTAKAKENPACSTIYNRSTPANHISLSFSSAHARSTPSAQLPHPMRSSNDSLS